MSSTTDRIVKEVILRSPRERVWKAIADSTQFGRWFGVRFDAPFAPGAHISGIIKPTTVDAEIAAAQAPYEGKKFDVTVERIEPQSLFSFRWHPYAVDQDVDYSCEPTTLVEFILNEVEGGTRLTIIESGFDRIPVHRRAKAFESNSYGWEAQAMLIGKYLHDAA
jgi:uncharacterized protein YndB with AHSA1/START domain